MAPPARQSPPKLIAKIRFPCPPSVPSLCHPVSSWFFILVPYQTWHAETWITPWSGKKMIFSRSCFLFFSVSPSEIDIFDCRFGLYAKIPYRNLIPRSGHGKGSEKCRFEVFEKWIFKPDQRPQQQFRLRILIRRSNSKGGYTNSGFSGLNLR